MEFTLKFSEAQMQLLSKAVQELPYREAMPMIQHVQSQVNEQTRPPVKADEPVSGPATGE